MITYFSPDKNDAFVTVSKRFLGVALKAFSGHAEPEDIIRVCCALLTQSWKEDVLQSKILNVNKPLLLHSEKMGVLLSQPYCLGKTYSYYTLSGLGEKW